ncbi:MAG: hypothetical protein MK132_16670 [Lentisphaerales bacterium]|nr:hypothetical protein [Lentisphaerales bacterium]
MTKLLMKTILLLLIITLLSCRQAKTTVYSTETLNCLTELISAKKQGIDSMIEVSKKYQDSFRFAEELQDKLSDRYTIEKAQSCAVKGEFNKAYDILNDRVVERGFNKALSKSLDTINAARLVERYISNLKTDSLSITEQAREFARVEANCDPTFRTSSPYLRWVKQQRQVISKKVIKDKQNIQESFATFNDILSLKDPQLLEISLLQEFLFNKSNPYPQIKTPKNNKKYQPILKLGSNLFIKENFQKQTKTFITIPVNCNEQFQNIQFLASKGKTLKCLEKLQMLQTKTDIASQLRQNVISSLIKSNGWNNAFLINGNLLDISYILETFYMANN